MIGRAFAVLLYAVIPAAAGEEDHLIPAGPGVISVSQLHTFCSSPNGSEGQTACAAYLMGVVHGLQIGTKDTKRGEPFCIPASITAPQAIQMFNDAVAKNPDLAPGVGAAFWAAVLGVKFACPKSN
jgi:hypothetical protein